MAMKRGIDRWALLALIAAVGAQVVPVAEASAQTVSGEAYGVYANTVTAQQGKSPYAAVPVGGWMDDAEALGVSLSGIVAAENLFAMASGAGDPDHVTTESNSTAERVNILSGLITADGIVAIASSAIDGTLVSTNAEGSHFVELVVNGVSMSATPAPNTRVDLPGVGYVILNEQTPRGDGVNSTGIAVRMIHVVLKDALTGVTTGEIVVGSAESYVAR